MPLDILLASALVLYLAIAVVLVRKYSRTRDIGFVWLCVAVVGWPFLSSLIERGERVLIDRVAKGHLVGFYPFSLVEHGQMTLGSLVLYLNLLQRLVGVGLLLVAVLYLCKTKSNSIQTTA